MVGGGWIEEGVDGDGPGDSWAMEAFCLGVGMEFDVGEGSDHSGAVYVMFRLGMRSGGSQRRRRRHIDVKSSARCSLS